MRRCEGARVLVLWCSGALVLRCSGALARAVAVNVEIMRAFVELRRVVESTAGLSRKLDALERKYDGQFQSVFEAIRQLMAPGPNSRRKIGTNSSGGFASGFE